MKQEQEVQSEAERVGKHGLQRGVGRPRRACAEWALLRAMGHHENEEGGVPDSGSRQISLAVLQGME